jgi:hypothetical protein
MDGRTVDGGIVELALLVQAANGITLDPGQAALVRSMSMSGVGGPATARHCCRWGG